MKTPTCLFSLCLCLTVATAASADKPPLKDALDEAEVERDPDIVAALRDPLDLGPLADAFKVALHTEEVKLDLDAAGAQYAEILKKFHAQDDRWASGAAALSLFHLAEIRRRQGREEEARKHYEEVIENFSDWEPMTGLARQQLGIDPADFLPEVTRVERKRELTENVWRDLWEIETPQSDDKFVLVTFKVELDKEVANAGIPEGYEIQTILYTPGGRMSGRISCTHAGIGTHGKPIREMRSIRVTGFGHSYDVPTGLVQVVAASSSADGWTGLRDQQWSDASVSFSFQDHWKDTTKDVSVRFTLRTINLEKARELAEDRSLTLPELGDTGWSLTLPPSPAKLEALYSEE